MCIKIQLLDTTDILVSMHYWCYPFMERQKKDIWTVERKLLEFNLEATIRPFVL